MSKRDYEDPSQPGALGGVSAFAKAHKLLEPDAKKILEQVLSYTLHKPVRKRFPTSPTLVFGRDEQWQMDLVDMQKLSKWNKGFKYMLTVIDVFSKVAWAEPLKTKSAKNMIEALNRLTQHFPVSPLRIQTDKGTEFLNKLVQAWFKKHHWDHFYTLGDAKASVIERWHRTLKQRMFRYFTAHNTLKWIDVLPHLVISYNETYHRSIGMAPIEVNDQNEEEVWNTLFGKRMRPRKGQARPPSLRVGDKVRLNKKHRPFKKGYLPGWTEEVFSVSKVRSSPRLPVYKIVEWDGTPIKGTFYEQDLQKVQVDDQSLFRVEKVLRKQKGLVKVRWKGWPSKYDSWIPVNGTQKANAKKN